MPAFLSQVVSQLKNLWLELTGAQRLIVSAVIAATLVGMAALIWVSTRPSYEPLPVAVSRSESPGVISLLDQVEHRLPRRPRRQHLGRQRRHAGCHAAADRRGLHGGRGQRPQGTPDRHDDPFAGDEPPLPALLAGQAHRAADRQHARGAFGDRVREPAAQHALRRPQERAEFERQRDADGQRQRRLPQARGQRRGDGGQGARACPGRASS